MIIEQKRLSSLETTLFFPKRFPISGVIYYNKEHAPLTQHIDLLDNILSCGEVESLLLTENFIYLQSTDTAHLEDIEALTMAEISEYNFDAPKISMPHQEHTAAQIKLILKIIVAPFLQRDGGDIELVSYNNGTAIVHFLGKCQGCPYAQKTLKERVEKNLIYYLPEVREVVLQ